MHMNIHIRPKRRQQRGAGGRWGGTWLPGLSSMNLTAATFLWGFKKKKKINEITGGTFLCRLPNGVEVFVVIYLII
jgi:hypothetical protein